MDQASDSQTTGYFRFYSARIWRDVPRVMWAVFAVEGIFAVILFLLWLGNRRLGQAGLEWFASLSTWWFIGAIALVFLHAVTYAYWKAYDALEQKLLSASPDTKRRFIRESLIELVYLSGDTYSESGLEALKRLSLRFVRDAFGLAERDRLEDLSVVPSTTIDAEGNRTNAPIQDVWRSLRELADRLDLSGAEAQPPYQMSFATAKWGGLPERFRQAWTHDLEVRIDRLVGALSNRGDDQAYHLVAQEDVFTVKADIEDYLIQYSLSDTPLSLPTPRIGFSFTAKTLRETLQSWKSLTQQDLHLPAVVRGR